MKLYKTTIEILTIHDPSSKGLTTLANDVLFDLACCVTHKVDSVNSSEYGDWVKEFFKQLPEETS